MNKIKALQTIVASLVLLLAVAPAMAGPTFGGSVDERGREVKVGWKFALGQEKAEAIRVPASYMDNNRIAYVANGGVADKAPLYKSKGLWISIVAIVAVVMIGDNNDWSFSSSSSESKTVDTDGRSLTIELANGSTVGDDINISNLTINNFSTPEAPEAE